MRRLLPALLAGVLLLAGCSSSEADAASVTSAETSYAGASEAEQETQDVTLAKTVLFDQDGIRITATGLSTDSLFGPELNLLVENDSAQNIVVQPNYCMVNGYMMDGLLSADVAAGKKANDTLDFLSNALARCGIETITDIELDLVVSDGDSWQTLYETGPVILQTSVAGQYTQTYDDSGEEIYNQNGIRVVAKSVNDDLFGMGIKFYLENNTDKTVIINADNVSVNGYMMTDLFYSDLAPRSHAVDTLTLLGSELEDNHIDTITDAELSLQITDADYYQTIDSTAPITLHF
ncbi:hypothetical protein [uncultured Gemmiger sp.]|uniref:hypothetical protein n=1 Tax=uncultured Gemmiger sp. TaxID=1623490 RepID=UPI00261882DB|nr:hypothetical protein [uncultured Gemmiger sp.]